MTGAPGRSEERHDEAPGVTIGPDAEADDEEQVSVAVARPGDRGLAAFGWEPITAIPGHVARLEPGGVLVVLRDGGAASPIGG
jgi:hypothetical protein